MGHRRLGKMVLILSLKVWGRRLELGSKLEVHLLDSEGGCVQLEQAVESQGLHSAADENSSSSRPSYCLFLRCRWYPCG